MTALAFVLGGLCLLVGARSAIATLRAEPTVDESSGVRVLIALHDAARTGFWLALGGLFIGFGLVDDDESFRWFAIVPIAMAGLRLLAAARLARR